MNRSDLYVEVDHTHPLSWRIIKSSPPTSLVLLCQREPRSLRSSRGICVQKYKRDNNWALEFSLASEGLSGNFSAFCKDMIESSRNVDLDDSTDFVAAQYLKWKELFRQITNGLDKAKIQGLMGEMMFLKDVLIPRYGEGVAVDSWVGPYKNKQDFQTPDMWYEVKTITEGRNDVKITSLDQLDRSDKGRLVVIKVRDSSPVTGKCMTINTLYRQVMDILSPWSQCKFQAALHSIGFECNEMYEEFTFEVLSIAEHEIMDDFPRIRRSKTESGVISAEYEISLDAICKFEVR